MLTIGTDSPAYDPWFDDNDPTNGKGFESAVAYAVAEEMGFAESDVKWIKVGFNSPRQAGRQGLRLRHQPGLDLAGAGRGRRLLRGLLLGRAGGDRAQGQRGRGRHHPRGAQGPEARRPDRYDVAHRDPGDHPARPGPGGPRRHQRRQAAAPERHARRDRRRPADRALHQRRGDPGLRRWSASSRSRAARPRSSACSSSRAASCSRASTSRWRASRRTAPSPPSSRSGWAPTS